MTTTYTEQEFDIVLLSTFTQVEWWRKQHARHGESGLFGQRVTTFNAWIADLWELYGDGRVLIDSLQRSTVMQAAFDHMFPESHVTDKDNAAYLPGTVQLAARCMRRAAGIPAFEHLLDDARAMRSIEGITYEELQFCQALDCYRELIFAADFIELGQATTYLANHEREVFAHSCRVLLVPTDPPSWIEDAFFAACSAIEVQRDTSLLRETIGSVPQGVDLRFAFPTGVYAQPGIVAQLCTSFAEESAGACADACADTGAGELAGAPAKTSVAQDKDALLATAFEDSGAPEQLIVVAAEDPLKLYKHLEQPLARAGLTACVQSQIAFSETDFGRQFLLLHKALTQDQGFKERLSDAARPPFSGFDAALAQTLDKSLRADRIAQRDDCLTVMRALSDTFSQLEELVTDPDADVLLGTFEQIAFAEPRRSAAWRAEQLGAIAAVRACTTAARKVGASIHTCAQVLRDTVITASYEFETSAKTDADTVTSQRAAESGRSAVSYESTSGDAKRQKSLARVLFTTRAVAATMEPHSCDMLILCDLTTDGFPIAKKETADDTLFAKVRLVSSDTELARTRRMFSRLLALPRKRVVCMRPLNDVDGAPTYPAAMLQELIDTYREDPTAEDDSDTVFGVPEHLLDNVVVRGEDVLFANAAAASDTALCQREKACVSLLPTDSILPEQHSFVALSRRNAEGTVVAGFSPSASQIESYLSCPHKWFAQSRLNLEQLDEGFGPLERGTFAHAALARFYTAFKELGYDKVTPALLDKAQHLMHEVVEYLAKEQREMDPLSGRYVAADYMEQRLLEMCKRQLVDYLDFEAAFLPTFAPAYLEYDIPLDAGVVYADHPFVGVIDRIDVDDKGHAVIVDYKGSLNSSHEIAGKTFDNPGKVQARIYAQLVKRVLGLEPVGAVYVSYGAKQGCAGAYDHTVLGPGDLPGINVKKCPCAATSKGSLREVASFSELTFADMLDATEDLVGQTIQHMEAGQVPASPLSSDDCRYCPVQFCPQRGV